VNQKMKHGTWPLLPALPWATPPVPATSVAVPQRAARVQRPVSPTRTWTSAAHFPANFQLNAADLQLVFTACRSAGRCPLSGCYAEPSAMVPRAVNHGIARSSRALDA